MTLPSADLESLHQWLIDVANVSSAYDSRMLMRAAEIVGKGLAAERQGSAAIDSASAVAPSGVTAAPTIPLPSKERVYHEALLKVATYFGGNPRDWPDGMKAANEMVEIADKALDDAEALQVETECAHCREVYEIYAGMEGFQPETAPEGYQCRIIEQMREAAEKGLHRQVCELHPHYYLPCPSCVDRKRRAQKTGREPAFDPDVRVLSSEEVARGLTLNNIATFAYPPWHRKRYCDSGLRLMGISDTRPRDRFEAGKAGVYWNCPKCHYMNDANIRHNRCGGCGEFQQSHQSEEARHE